MFLSQLPVLSKSALLLSGSDPPRDEIGLIPCPEARYNRSPIVMVENKLGVESWCVKFLLPYVHNKLLLYRQRRLWLDRQGRPGSESSSVYLCVRTSLEQVVWYSLVSSHSFGGHHLHPAAAQPGPHHGLERPVRHACPRPNTPPAVRAPPLTPQLSRLYGSRVRNRVSQQDPHRTHKGCEPHRSDHCRTLHFKVTKLEFKIAVRVFVY